MAGIEHLQQPVRETAPITSVTEVSKKPIDQAMDDKKVSLPDDDKKERIKKELPDLVAVSEFGDTLQVSKKGREQSEDKKTVVGEDGEMLGEVTGFASEEKSALKVSREEGEKQFLTKQTEKKEEEDKKEKQISSYEAYTDAQMQQLYLQHKITRYDYETEMKKRVDEREDEREDDLKEEIEQKTGINQAIFKAERTGQAVEAVEKAYEEETSETTTPKTRIEIMEALNRQQQEEQQQEDAQWRLII